MARQIFEPVGFVLNFRSVEGDGSLLWGALVSSRYSFEVGGGNIRCMECVSERKWILDLTFEPGEGAS